MALSALTIDCNDKGSWGGIRRMWAVSASGVEDTAFTISSGQVTAFTSSGSFVEIQTMEDQITWSWTPERGDSGNVVDTHEIVAPVPNMTTSIRNLVEEYKNTCDLILLVEDNGDPNDGTANNRLWIVGVHKYERMRLTTAPFESGQAMADKKGINLTFGGRMRISPYEYTGAAPS